MTKMSRGLRNRNPGNIRLGGFRYRGEKRSSDTAFRQFESIEWGYRAMFVVLHTYAVKHNCNTLRKNTSCCCSFYTKVLQFQQEDSLILRSKDKVSCKL